MSSIDAMVKKAISQAISKQVKKNIAPLKAANVKLAKSVAKLERALLKSKKGAGKLLPGAPNRLPKNGATPVFRPRASAAFEKNWACPATISASSWE